MSGRPALLLCGEHPEREIDVTAPVTVEQLVRRLDVVFPEADPAEIERAVRAQYAEVST
jgi:hypothetical protein